MNIPILIFLFIPLTLPKIVPKALEQLNVNIWAERHRSIHTDFNSINTKVHTDSPPLKQTATLMEMTGKDKCEVSLHLHLCGDHLSKRSICIYREILQDSFGRVVEQGTMLNLEGMDMSMKQLYKLTVPVIGFVVNEPNSVVKGYIIKKQFYGTIRMYDQYRLYHVVYYIEPLSVIPLYNRRYKDEEFPYKPNHNAVMFEYVSHSSKAEWFDCVPKPIIPVTIATASHKTTTLSSRTNATGTTTTANSSSTTKSTKKSSITSKATTKSSTSESSKQQTSTLNATTTELSQNVSSTTSNTTQQSTSSITTESVTPSTSRASTQTGSSTTESSNKTLSHNHTITQTMVFSTEVFESPVIPQTMVFSTEVFEFPNATKPSTTTVPTSASSNGTSPGKQSSGKTSEKNATQNSTVKLTTQPPIQGDNSTPYHSTNVFFLFHSTEVSPLTGDEFGRQILGHSTEMTGKTFAPPEHSTEASTFTTGTQSHSTGMSPLDHSTDSTPTIDRPVHLTEMITPAVHSTHKTTTFRPSTEVTRSEKDSEGDYKLPTDNAKETSETTTKTTTTTRKILNSEEVLAQLSTEIIPWPYHSTEQTAETTLSTTTPTTTKTKTLGYSFFSTEVTPVTLLLNHSTVATTEDLSIEHGGGTTRLRRRTTKRVTINLNHSTQVPAHSTEITRTTINTTVLPTTTTESPGPSTSSHLDHSTQPMIHSTVITVTTHTVPNTTTTTPSTTTKFELKHSTDANTPLIHSTVITRTTRTTPITVTAGTNATTDSTTTVKTTPGHSTDRLDHSTDVNTPTTPTTKTTTAETTTKTTTPTTTLTSTTTVTTTPTTASTSTVTTTPSTTTGVIHSTMKPFHSTDGPDKSDELLRRRKRQINFNNFFLENVLEEDEADVAETVPFAKGTVESDIFDIKRDKSFTCSMCVWIQPHFAESFGLGGGLLHGVAEVLDLIKFTDQIFRAIDFNQDGIPENIGFKVRRLLLSDEISLTKTGTQGRKRKKRDYVDDGTADIFHNLYEHGVDEAWRDKREDFDFNSDNSYDKYDQDNGLRAENEKQKMTRSKQKQLLEKNLNEFERDPKKVEAENGLAWIANQLEMFTDCCVRLGFIYHDLTPTVAATTERGLCSEKNLGLVSGLQHEHKILKYDVFRGIMHSLGHLFGASHTPFADPACFDEQLYDFINPFPLHPIQQSNVGVRPNTFRFSQCTKDSITMFLSSNGASCLKEHQSSFCGNGLVEEGEDCDCGSLWQCHLRYPCCGESDTLMGCKVIIDTKKSCYRPTIW